MASKILKNLCIILFIKCSSFLCQDLPSFRIIAPQNICKSTDENGTVATPQGVLISFLPKDDMVLTYKLRIFFKTLGPEIFTQRETLVIWKAVRTLEHRINIIDRLNISAYNMLFINKTEVVAGVNYIFHVTGITDAGETTKEQICLLKYSNGIFQNGNITDGMNLLLIGSEKVVASVSYSLYAKVSFCKPYFNFYFRWKIHNLDEEFQELQHQRGSTLYIPANTLTARTKTKVEVQVCDMNSSHILAKDSIDLTVVEKGFQAYIVPSSAKIGVNTTLPLQVFLRDFDNNIEKIEIFWENYITDVKSEVISNFSLCNTRCAVSFKSPGRYNVLANIKLNGVTTTIISNIEVAFGISSSFDFEYVPNLNPSSNELFTFSVMVINLFQKCKAGWISAQEDGYEFISEEELGIHNFGQIIVGDLESKYLSDIIDIENLSVNKEINLLIPPSDPKNSKWKGLQGNVKYKFRLDVVCPKSDREAEKTTSSSFEFFVDTNSPPKTAAVQIKPQNGIALKTIFFISISEAKDIMLDSPISYELCGLFDDYEICFGKFMEYKSWEIVLPYTKAKVALYIVVCDIRNACKTVHGNTVSLITGKITEQDFLLQKQKIHSSFLRSDFMEGLNDISLISITYKNSKSPFLSEFRTFVEDIFAREIDKMLERTTISSVYSIENILNFILHIKINMEILSIFNLEIIKNLLYIMELIPVDSNTIYPTPEPSSQMYNLEFRDGPHMEFKSLLSSPLEKSYAEITLLLIHDLFVSSRNTNSTEKYVGPDHIFRLMERMCFSNSVNNEHIESPIAIIMVQKYTGNFLLKKEFLISNSYIDTKLKQKISFYNNNPAISHKSSYCLSIVQFPEDYFTGDNTPLTNVKMYDLTTSDSILEWTLGDNMKTISKKYIIELEIAKNRMEENMCVFRMMDKWSPNNCKLKSVNLNTMTCSCTHLGFYRLSTKLHEPTHDTGAVRPTPTKNIISFPKENHISTVTLTYESEMPYTQFTMATLSITSYTTMMTTTSAGAYNIPSRNVSKNINLEAESVKSTSVTKASTMGFVIPLIIIVTIALFTLLFLIYYRRFPPKNNKGLSADLNLQLQRRHRQNGIVYARIYDDYLMDGSV